MTEKGFYWKFLFITVLLGAILIPTFGTPIFGWIGIIFIFCLLLSGFMTYNKITKYDY